MVNVELSGKRLLVMGGMRISCEIIQKAQSMGIVVGVADYNPVYISPGKQIADEHYEIDITKVDDVVNLIKTKAFDGIIVGFNDMLLPYYAEICSKASLPCYGTKEQFEILTRKDLYKSLCRLHNVPTIREFKLEDTGIVFPVLVKPVDSSGSRGITVCNGHDELLTAYQIAISQSRVRKAVIEEYEDGDEVTVFWIFQNGDYFLSAMANRHMKNNQGADVIPLPVGYTFPSKYLSKYRLEVEDNCKKMFHSLGLKNGMLFMQCKVVDGICEVYDIGYRLTGSLEYRILERMCGYNPLEMMICYALSGDMGEPELNKKVNPEFTKPAFNVSCLCKPGQIQKIEGLREVAALNGIEGIIVDHPEGDSISEEMKGLLSQIAIRVIGVVEDVPKLYSTIKKVEDTIQIVSDKGDQLLLPGIEYNDINGYLF